jgi:hypothetical protein
MASCGPELAARDAGHARRPLRFRATWLHPDGAYCDVKDVEAESTENVSRLAALFHLLKFGRGGSVDDEIIRQAMDIGQWYLNETQMCCGKWPFPRYAQRTRDR